TSYVRVDRSNFAAVHSPFEEWKERSSVPISGHADADCYSPWWRLYFQKSECSVSSLWPTIPQTHVAIRRPPFADPLPPSLPSSGRDAERSLSLYKDRVRPMK